MFADRIILNKSDLGMFSRSTCLISGLVPKEKLELISKSIRDSNSMAELTSTNYSEVEVSFLFDIHTFDRSMALTRFEESKQAGSSCASKFNVEHHVLEFKGDRASFGVDMSKFKQVIGELLWNSEEICIYRMKGVICVPHDEFKYFLQAVGNVFEIEKAESQETVFQDSLDRMCRILIIGSGIKLGELYPKFLETILY